MAWCAGAPSARHVVMSPRNHELPGLHQQSNDGIRVFHIDSQRNFLHNDLRTSQGQRRFQHSRRIKTSVHRFRRLPDTILIRDYFPKHDQLRRHGLV